ncbi:MAG: UDP-N-acetylglucosamine 1-carboxyvinyltransferase [Planctomycetaceae bacterium]
MDLLEIEGGVPLTGRATVSGSKNAALPIIAAAIACDGPVELHGIPDLVDVRTLLELLSTLGVQSSRHRQTASQEDAIDTTTVLDNAGPSGVLRLETIDTNPVLADYELVRRMRASVCVLGPLLGRRGRACVSLPGGCNIGHRPIDLHLKGLAALGAEIRVERGYVFAEAEKLRGADISLLGPQGSTVTGTCNVMSAAVFADGITTIEGAACEPEVVDFGLFLNRAGASISGLGTPTVRVEGTGRLTGTTHTVIPDRIEAATLLAAAVITRGRVSIANVVPEHLTAVLVAFRDMGVRVEIQRVAGTTELPGSEGAEITVDVPGSLRPIDLTALPYPGVPTDVQAQFTAVLSTVPGMSRVTDRVFPERFMHVSELLRMGAQIRHDGGMATIQGGGRLTGAQVMASDLRASAALVLAALAAEGETVIRRIYHLDRGYEKLEQKLRSLGARIERRKEG